MELSTFKIRTKDKKTISELRNNIENEIEWAVTVGPLYIGVCRVFQMEVHKDIGGTVFEFEIEVIND